MTDKEDMAQDPGRRQYDGSTGKMMAYGIGGGSVIGVLTTVFMFMNNAPWAAKSEMESLRQDLRKVEASVNDYNKDQNAMIIDISSLRTNLTSINDKLDDLKSDIKEIKNQRRRQ